MFKLNNRGQSLVMFVIIIPIFLLIITLVYDVGNAIYEKNRIENVVYMTIDYGLDNVDKVSKNDLTELIMENINNIKYISVDIDDKKIDIKVTKDVKGIVGKIFKFNLITIETHYVGNIVDGKSSIERIVWCNGR